MAQPASSQMAAVILEILGAPCLLSGPTKKKKSWLSTCCLSALFFHLSLAFLSRTAQIPPALIAAFLLLPWRSADRHMGLGFTGVGLPPAQGGGAIATIRHSQAAAATLLEDLDFKIKFQLPASRQIRIYVHPYLFNTHSHTPNIHTPNSHTATSTHPTPTQPHPPPPSLHLLSLPYTHPHPFSSFSNYLPSWYAQAFFYHNNWYQLWLQMQLTTFIFPFLCILI